MSQSVEGETGQVFAGMWRLVVFSWDFIGGIIGGVGALVMALLFPEVRETSREVLIATFAAGSGLLGFVMQAQATFTSHIGSSRHYQEIIERVGGWRLAMLPYKVTARVAGCTAVWSLVVWVPQSIAPAWVNAMGLAVAVLGAIWSIVGAIQVQGITSLHGAQSFKLQRYLRKSKSIMERRREGTG
jgi:hypothetical protein